MLGNHAVVLKAPVPTPSGQKRCILRKSGGKVPVIGRSTDAASWRVSVVGQLSCRVLLVDDDPLILKLVTRYLLVAGYVVRTAADGLEAVAKLRAGLPDLIISDLNMPGMGGVEFLGVVRRRFPQIPVIAMGGISKDELPDGLAADAYCCKAGSGFQELLATAADLAGMSARRAPAPPPCHEPVLASWDGNSHYTLGCDECLREFTVQRVFHRGQSERWATCVHCGKLLRFLVAVDNGGNLGEPAGGN